jgi:hypothetical protein
MLCICPIGCTARSNPPFLPQQAADADYSCDWELGGKRCCGTLKNPGVAYGGRADETDHCFPGDASHHYVCCVDVQVRWAAGSRQPRRAGRARAQAPDARAGAATALSR